MMPDIKLITEKFCRRVTKSKRVKRDIANNFTVLYAKH